MSRNSALVLALLFGGLVAPGCAFAQLTPPAGSAGAGNSPISGVPFGPANPRVLSDPSGIGNASAIPPLGTNTPVRAPPAYRPIGPVPSRVVVPYAGASQRIINARPIRARRPQFRGRRRPQTSSFKGICRGC
jgi:hypothetical protein